MSKYQEYKETIKNNYPPSNYTMLREALDVSMELLDKATPKQLENDYYCPNCTSRVKEYNPSNDRNDYCGQCGQALDWSDEE